MGNSSSRKILDEIFQICFKNFERNFEILFLIRVLAKMTITVSEIQYLEMVRFPKFRKFMTVQDVARITLVKAGW